MGEMGKTGFGYVTLQGLRPLLMRYSARKRCTLPSTFDVSRNNATDFVQGINDRTPWFAPTEETLNRGPKQPDTMVLDINLTAVAWCAYLGMHYMRRNESKGGTIVLTASVVGLYPLHALPLYSVAKAGVCLVLSSFKYMSLNSAPGCRACENYGRSSQNHERAHHSELPLPWNGRNSWSPYCIHKQNAATLFVA